jgi:hypothetical protein
MKGKFLDEAKQREHGRARGLANRRHGLTMTPEHRVWRNIHQRCENPNDEHYPDYGGRGIRVCERWASFEAFLEDMGTRPGCGYTIDRRDVNGDYEPGNCRWATVAEQNRNKRTTKLVTFDGRTMCVAEWARESGVSRNLILYRLAAGWPVERALREPSRRPSRVVR